MQQEELQIWLAQNLMCFVAPESLERVAQTSGVSAETVRSWVSVLREEPTIEAGQRLNRQILQRDWLLSVFEKLRTLSAKRSEIERRPSLSKDHFIQEFYCNNQPIIITDMAQSWPALHRWNPEYFKQLYGDSVVEIQKDRNINELYEILRDHHRSKMKFADYIDLIENTEAANNYYMTARNFDINRPLLRLLGSDLGNVPDFLVYDPASSDFRLWYGAEGTVTPLHFDFLNLAFFQIRGRKRFRLIPPTMAQYLYNNFNCYSEINLENIDYDRYPLYRNVEPYEVILHPGEMLFIPVGWWHHVKSLDVAVSVTFLDFCVPNNYPAASQLEGRML